MKNNNVPVQARGLALALTAAALLILPLQASAAERITATVANLSGGAGRPGTVPVSIYLYSDSEQADIDRLSNALATKGPDGLREAMWDLEKGWVRIGDSLGYPIAVVVTTRLEDGGRRIVLFADRPILFFETWRSTRSRDYPFSYFDIKLDKDGNGSGEFFPAARVKMADGAVVIENFGIQPAKLLGARLRP